MQKLIYNPLCGGPVEIKPYSVDGNRHPAKNLDCVQKIWPFVILMGKNNKLLSYIMGEQAACI